MVRAWVEVPTGNSFAGREEFFQHRLPIDPSQISRWRQRIGSEGVKKQLQATIAAGMRGVIDGTTTERVIVDTTVQPKAVEHPTDARLYRKVHAAMLRIAAKEGITLRQSYRKA